MNYDFKSVYNPQCLLDVDAAKKYIDDLAATISKGFGNPKIQEINFAIPDNPVLEYNKDAGVILVYTPDGEVAGAIPLSKDKDGNAEFPVTIKDTEGKVYEITKGADDKVEMTLQKQSTSNMDDPNDTKTYFVIQKITSDSINIEDVKKMAEDKMNENEYHSTRSKIVIDEGKYICIPVQKNVTYLQNGKTITKNLKELILYSMKGYKDNVLVCDELNWEQNPFNRYDITINGTTMSDKNYILFNVNNGDSCKIEIMPSRQATTESVMDSCGTSRGISLPNVFTPYNISLYGKKLESGVVYFEADNHKYSKYEGDYGFDKYEDKLSAFKGKYTDKFDIIKDDGSKVEYYPPYISNWAGESVQIKAIIKANLSDSDIYYTFESSAGLTVTCNHESYNNGKFEAKNGDYVLDITLTGSAPKDILLVKDKNGKTVGKLIFYSKDKQGIGDGKKIHYKVVNVTFGNTPSNTTPTTVDVNNYIANGVLENYFNVNSFNQTFTQFKCAGIDNLNITDAEITAKGITLNAAGQLVMLHMSPAKFSCLV